MAVIGYMRVSTAQQKFDSQEKALRAYGVDRLYKEHESGKKTDRNQLNRAIKSLNPGDTFVIFKLDRLARTTKQLLALLERFEQDNIHFVSIQNHIDTSTPMGKFFFTVMGAFSEMEAELIRERVIAGLEAAKENGKILGRPPIKQAADNAIELYLNTDLTVYEIAKESGVSVTTIYNYLNRYGIKKKYT